MQPNFVTLEQVAKVYSGKADRCFCGCSGTYYYPGDKGFERMAQKVVNMLNEADGYNRDMDEDTFCSTQQGGRVYAVYYAENPS